MMTPNDPDWVRAGAARAIKPLYQWLKRLTHRKCFGDAGGV
jgi:hypothetical protein